MRTSKKLISIVLITALTAGLCTGTALAFKRLLTPAVTPASVTSLEVVSSVSMRDQISGKPTRILVPALQIDNQVENGVYDGASHTWNLSNNNAHHAETSAPANAEGGNTFIYGHNSRQIFVRLPTLPIGGQAILETASSTKFYYQLESISEVQPSDVAVLDYSGPPILTIQTCSGNWNEKRQMFRFKLLHVEIPATS